MEASSEELEDGILVDLAFDSFRTRLEARDDASDDVTCGELAFL